MQELKQRLLAQAKGEGFDQLAICQPSAVPQMQADLRAFLAKNYHGQMAWLEDRQAWRSDPSALWPEAKSVIMLARSYAPSEDPMAVLAQPDRGTISVYARNKDYHDVIKKRLKALARWLIAEQGGAVKVFVDTAPVPEKPLAQAAGLGWQGKHTNLVSRSLGNWFFLGAIFTTLDLPLDEKEPDHCGSCQACLQACPTQAFPAPYQLDARRCISYLTIEHKGPVDLDLRAQMGNRIYGCDDCQLVCPWNKFAQQTGEPDFTPRHGLDAIDLVECFNWDEPTFLARTEGSAIRRIGFEQWRRNVAIALGNAESSDAIRTALQAALEDPSELVREHVQWALAQHH